MANPASIVTRDLLIAAVTEYLLNQDLQTNDVPLFITFAEDRFDKKLRMREMLAAQTGNLVVGAPTLTLPTDYLETQVFTVTEGGQDIEMKLVSPQWLTQVINTNGIPFYYTIDGANIRIGPPSDATRAYSFSYYQKIPRLTAFVPSNWLLLKDSLTYFSAVMYEGYKYFEDENRAEYWKGKTDEGVDELIKADMRARWRPYSRIRPDGPSDGIWRTT